MKDEILGNIHSIESMSTVDGPGIRYVVFMQGCPLRCKFCHNVDTWSTEKNRMYTAEELARQIINAKEYFELSGGGVTFTGGEPLLQTKFLIKVCKILKENNIHITLDSSGAFEITDDIKELLNYVDLILLDIKHINNEKHKFMTGRENTKVLEFARYLDKINKNVWIRIVYIPDFTDFEKEKLKDFISSLDNVKKVDVLKYHTMGKYKWEKLGIKYELDDYREPETKEVQDFYNYLVN